MSHCVDCGVRVGHCARRDAGLGSSARALRACAVPMHLLAVAALAAVAARPPGADAHENRADAVTQRPPTGSDVASLPRSSASATAANVVGACRISPGRYVRAWTTAGSLNTSALCNARLRLLIQHRQSLDELSPIMLYSVVPDGNGGVALANKEANGANAGNSNWDAATVACYRQIKKQLGLRLTPTISDGDKHQWTNSAADNGSSLAAAATAAAIANDFDGFDLDWENKYVANTTKLNLAVNQLAMALHATGNRTLTRYAGCVHNHEPPYWGETCQQFLAAAPAVDRVAAAGPYWDNSPAGFEGLVRDAVNSSGGPASIPRISIAVCPFGCAHPVTLTQQQLYERMDMMCALGLRDVYVFTLDALLETGKDARLSSYWLKAMRYFRTGHKV